MVLSKRVVIMVPPFNIDNISHSSYQQVAFSQIFVCGLSSLAQQSSNMNGSGDGGKAEADIKAEVEAK